MARISGVDLPNNKRAEIALTYIYGIGRSRSKEILATTKIDLNRKMMNVTDEEIHRLREYIETSFTVEGELRTEISLNIKRLMEIDCYRGLRHKKSLPVRGQKTKNNSRTRKGKKRVSGKKR